MTKNLTPDLFTPQYGFVEGVVLQIARRSTPPYFDDGIMIYGELDRVRDGVIVVGGTLIRIEDIVSISILTGPMRFWNGAPADAVGLAYDPDDMVPLRFYDLAVEFKHDRLRFLMSEHKYVFTARPWWCDFGKGE